jgi:hypothetical protein
VFAEIQLLRELAFRWHLTGVVFGAHMSGAHGHQTRLQSAPLSKTLTAQLIDRPRIAQPATMVVARSSP